jgi:DcmR-like sensory protein
MNEAHDVSKGSEPHHHFVQFYKADEPLLNRNVASFLWNGLLRGDGLLVIATQQRRESLASHLERLGADVGLARREGQLAMLDAHEMLSRIMPDGWPDWECFEHAIGDAIRLASPRVGSPSVCAYGEMVGVLWQDRQIDAAILLEEFWNQILRRGGMQLFCGYPIDVFADDLDKAQVHDVLRAHSHFLPTGPNGDLGDALNRAMDEVLHATADEVRVSMKASVSSLAVALPEAEKTILWLRNNIPDHAEKILARARGYYEATRAPQCAAETA